MFVVMGASGHVGSAVAKALLDAGEAVTVVTRAAEHAEPFRARGAEVAIADVRDVASLRAAFARGRRAFVLNPPADVKGDTDASERETVRCILTALAGTPLERVVAESTYGARAGDALGDLSTLHELEVGLRAQPISTTLVRAAYYFSNLDALIEPARSGVLPTTFPADLALPMVAPSDVGHEAARLLRAPSAAPDVVHVEGPSRCTFAEVARTFAAVLARPVDLEVAPRAEWETELQKLGFSPAAARSYARMTAVTVDDLELPTTPVRGLTSLADYVAALASRST